MAKDKYNPPAETLADQGHKLIRGGLGMIPIAGTSAIELFTTVIAPPLTRRHQEWMGAVAEGLRQLEEQNRIVQSKLAENDSFIDVLLNATRVSSHTSNDDMRLYLQNAVLNAAVDQTVEESLQQMYMDFLSSLTYWHIQFLKYLKQPANIKMPTESINDNEEPNRRWDKAYWRNAKTGLRDHFQTKRLHLDFINIVISDLFNRNLVKTGRPITTALADGLLKFIEFPTSNPE